MFNPTQQFHTTTRGRNALKLLVIGTVLVWSGNAQQPGCGPEALSSSDSFEGTVISQFWTVFGDPTLTSEIAHTGSQSIQMPAGSSISHSFPTSGWGSVSVYFYDDAKIRATSNSWGLFPTSNSAGTAGSYYLALPFGLSHYETGFGATRVARSAGWHSFRIDYTPTGIDFLIDGAVVETENAPVRFSGVSLGNQENTPTTFVDDFRVTAPVSSCALSFIDSFEGPTISPFWTVSSDPTLTSAIAHTGSQSIQMPAGSSISHSFPTSGWGSVSVYFYDDAKIRATSNSWGLFPTSNSAGTAGSYYLALPFGLSHYETGFGATRVARSAGWHSFRIDYTPTGIDFLIDGAVVKTENAPVRFSGVSLGNQENTPTTFVDDFSVTPPVSK